MNGAWACRRHLVCHFDKLSDRYFSLAKTQRNAKFIIHYSFMRRINDILFIFHCVVWYVSTTLLTLSAKFIILFQKSKCFWKFSGGGKSLIIHNFTSCIIKAIVLCTSLYLRQAQKDFWYFFIIPNSHLIRTNFVSDSYWKFHYFCSDLNGQWLMTND